MTLFNYNRPVPCYQTADITKYSRQLFKQATTLFQLVRERISHAYDVDDHCIIWEGSFSIKATNINETSAKIVMYQRGVGHWLGQVPHWSDGVYIWVRANDESGQAFEMVAQDPNFKHRWVLNRFIRDSAVSVAPNLNEHFYYFRMEEDDDRIKIAELLAFCCTL